MQRKRPRAKLLTAQVEQQLKLLEQESKTHKQPGMRQGFLFANYTIIFPYTVFQTLTACSQGDWQPGLLWGALALGSTQMYRLTLSLQQSKAARELAASNDVSWVGRLAEALEWPDSELRETAALALARLLPQMRASDSKLLNAKQRGCLYRMLKMSNANSHEKTLLGILQALEQVGDSAAIPHVERLVEYYAYTQRQKRVQAAAKNCLPALRLRTKHERASQQLLRASSASDIADTGETLLRPATSQQEEDPKQMLRASASE